MEPNSKFVFLSEMLGLSLAEVARCAGAPVLEVSPDVFRYNLHGQHCLCEFHEGLLVAVTGPIAPDAKTPKPE